MTLKTVLLVLAIIAAAIATFLGFNPPEGPPDTIELWAGWAATSFLLYLGYVIAPPEGGR